jgi:hypothetical protein
MFCPLLNFEVSCTVTLTAPHCSVSSAGSSLEFWSFWYCKITSACTLYYMYYNNVQVANDRQLYEYDFSFSQ